MGFGDWLDELGDFASGAWGWARKKTTDLTGWDALGWVEEKATPLIEQAQEKSVEIVTWVNKTAAETWEKVTVLADETWENAQDTYQEITEKAEDAFEALVPEPAPAEEVSTVPATPVFSDSLDALRQPVEIVASDPRSQLPLFATYISQLNDQVGTDWKNMPVELVDPAIIWNLKWLKGEHLIDESYAIDKNTTMEQLAAWAATDPKLRAYLNQQLAANWGTTDKEISYGTSRAVKLSNVVVDATLASADTSISSGNADPAGNFAALTPMQPSVNAIGD